MAQATRVSGVAVHIDHTPGSALSAGDVVVQVDLVGVADLDIAAGALGALNVGPTIYTLAKATGGGTALPVGTIAYWDDTNNRATASSSGNKIFGKVVKAAADADATVDVLLLQ